jgi:hypothetical protein
MKRTVFFSVLCLCSLISYASWQNPFFLSELNDFQNGCIATRPVVSSDENQILFVRHAPQGEYYLWQAQKNFETGIYAQQRILSELSPIGGRNIFGVWLSKDSLRLYYCADDSKAANDRWGRNLLMAIRNSPEDDWTPVRKHLELQADQYLSSVSLTADELYIMWTAASIGGNEDKILIATRPSLLHPFANIHDVPELEAMGARSPRLSIDGLTVYFMRESGISENESWIGCRDSLDMPFTEFSPINEINKSGFIYGNLCPSWDGKRAYYFQRQGESGDLNAAGIFVSEWIDDSYGDAVRNLQEAIADKEMAMQLVYGASEKELKAQQILNSLTALQTPEQFEFNSLKIINRNINQSLSRQDHLIKTLEAALNYLNYALMPLLPPMSAE